MKSSVGCLLIIILISGSTILSFSAQRGELTSNQKLARELLRELIEIKTTPDTGSTKAALAMAARLKKAGFPKRDIQVIGPHPDHLNLVVRYRGRGLQRPILFICHLDVVEALKRDWSFDPFKFREDDKYFYGRGTSDIKDEGADLISNLIRLKQEGFLPSRDIIVALTDGEETGRNNGIQWLIANHRHLVDAEYCINPDGGGGELKGGKAVVAEIQTSEKIYLDFSLEVKNNGGHSSVPVKDNAIYRLSAALVRLRDFEFPLRLNETTRMFFERSALQESGQGRDDMLKTAISPVGTAAANRLAEASPFYNALMRTTCVATVLTGGHASNALPQSARANVNCRMLPDDTLESVTSSLKSAIADDLVAIKCEYASTLSPLSPIRGDIMETFEKISGAIWPGVVVTPVMSTGATDGKFLRSAGIPVYGISGMFFDIEDIRAHGKDERIGMKEFYDGVEFMYRLIKRLSSEQD